MDSVRIRNAKSKVSLDKVLETVDTGDFVEITGRKGGDVLTYRVYNNGVITER